jgi:hypothetical protein
MSHVWWCTLASAETAESAISEQSRTAAASSGRHDGGIVSIVVASVVRRKEGRY